MDEESLESLGIDWKGPPAKWSTLPHSLLPKCCIRGTVKSPTGEPLFTLAAKEELGKGTYGQIDAFYKRFPSGEEITVAIKRPRGSDSILTEALVQWYLGKKLSSYGIPPCIPRVYDIFIYMPTKSIWFTMDAFRPLLFSQWCVKKIPSQPSLFPMIMVQLSILLEVFQCDALVDHRDLKVNNMLIVEEETSFPIIWKTKETTVTFPFRIIILDFGFACINNTIDVKDGLPHLDVCPKEGRDMFQLLVSLWNIPILRHSLEVTWGDWVRNALCSAKGDGNAYIRLAEGNHSIIWMYSVTQDREFSAHECSAKIVLENFMKYILNACALVK
jgi:serine/threonine protein kinase